jgi:hypothetical protein
MAGAHNFLPLVTAGQRPVFLDDEKRIARIDAKLF